MENTIYTYFTTFKVVHWLLGIPMPWPEDRDIIIDGKRGTQWDKYEGTKRVRELIRHYKPQYLLVATTPSEKTAVTRTMVNQLLNEDRKFYTLVQFESEPNTFIFEQLVFHESERKILSKMKEKIRDSRNISMHNNRRDNNSCHAEDFPMHHNIDPIPLDGLVCPANDTIADEAIS
jgi:hypothetical protein